MTNEDGDDFNRALDAAAKAKQGKVTGLIIPPPEVRAVVDKTAQFVARNGKSFEQRILASGEGKTAKFNFMKSHDPYHAYYEYKIREFEEGKETTSAPRQVAPQVTATEQPVKKVETASAKPSIPTPLARFAQNKPSEPPRAPQFCVQCPPGIASLDMDVIKLAAQYTALNGREFLSGLAQREQRNPQFDFLKPTHMLFSYFTSLVDSYARVLQPAPEQMHGIASRQSRMNALASSVGRWEWKRAEEEKKKKDALDSDAERAAFNAIDWYDFTVVETIEFGEHELFEPMGGLSLNNEPPAVAKPLQTNKPNVEFQALPPVRDTRQLLPPPPPPPPEEEDDDIKVVSDYKPRIATGSVKQATMIDPISGKAVPVENMSEHMRIQLMDPRWRIEQQRFQEKQQETGYAEGSSIADSLKSFARQRGDIFGHNEEEMQIEQNKRQKKNEVEDNSTRDNDFEIEQKPYMPIPSMSYSAAPISQAPPAPPAPIASSFPPIPAPPHFAPPFASAPPPSYMPNYPPPEPVPYYGHGMAAVPPQPPGYQPQQTAQSLIPEEEFAKRYPNPINISITVPNDTSFANWKLHGQSLSMSVGVMVLVKDLKDMISRELGGMPTNKQQLKHASGFLKDNQTLASYNIGNGVQLELSVRSRGGKK